MATKHVRTPSEEAAVKAVKSWPYAKRMERAVNYVHKYFDFSRTDVEAEARYNKTVSDAATVFFVREKTLHTWF